VDRGKQWRGDGDVGLLCSVWLSKNFDLFSLAFSADTKRGHKKRALTDSLATQFSFLFFSFILLLLFHFPKPSLSLSLSLSW
jgi:hypothetical protein